METFNKIASYRAGLGLTQKEMAERLGITSQQQYHLKESKKRPFTDSEKKAMKSLLSPYFPNITIDEIFFD